MKFYGGVRGGKKNKWLYFGSNLDHHADCPMGNPTITQQIMSGFWWNFQDSSTGVRNNWLNFGGGLDHYADSLNQESG